MFKLAELIIAAEAPADRRIEPLEAAGLFVLEPGLQLIANPLRHVGNQACTPLPDQRGSDALLVADEQDRPTGIQVLEDFAGKIAFVALIIPLEQP